MMLSIKDFWLPIENAHIKSHHKNTQEMVKRNVDLEVFYHICLNTLNDPCMIKSYEYLNKILSKYQFRFRRSFNTHQCLIAMNEKIGQFLDTDDT